MISVGRSGQNTKRLKVDFETAEAMLNHVKKGLERTYDRYDLEEEKRASFLKWEAEIADIAIRAGLCREARLTFLLSNPGTSAGRRQRRRGFAKPGRSGRHKGER